ncbi:hypothetical protein ACJX0J_009729, partial [Zea mays]
MIFHIYKINVIYINIYKRNIQIVVRLFLLLFFHFRLAQSVLLLLLISCLHQNFVLLLDKGLVNSWSYHYYLTIAAAKSS